ncbi:hypothetical protein [Sphingomonas zeae]
MQEFDYAVACFSEASSSDEDIANVMLRCAATKKVQEGLETLRRSTQSGGTVASLYLDFKALPLHSGGGWTLGLARIVAVPAAVSAPTAESASLCIEAAAPMVFDVYEDDTDYDPYDLRPERPVRIVGERTISHGDVVVLRGADRWIAPRGAIDATFLKLEGPIRRPLSVAFNRETLMPVHAGFADQVHTGRDFFATLLTALTAPGEPLATNVDPEEREALAEFLAHQSVDPELHLVTRWKYLQSLGRVDASRAIAPLAAIAAGSGSVIGERARATLAARGAASGPSRAMPS